MNASLRNALAGITAAMLICSQPASAQFATASLIHTVTVTVPPRVKVQATSLSASALARPGSGKAVATGGVRLSINATQRWVLAIGASRAATGSTHRVEWATDVDGSYSTLKRESATVAAGARTISAAQADLFLRDTASGDIDQKPATVLLTIVTP